MNFLLSILNQKSELQMDKLKHTDYELNKKEHTLTQKMKVT